MTASAGAVSRTDATPRSGHLQRLAVAVLVAALAGAGITGVLTALTSGTQSPLAAATAFDRGWGDLVRIVIALGAGVVVSVIDLREHRIPNLVTMPAGAALLASATSESVWQLVTPVATSDAWLVRLQPLTLTLLGLIVAGAVMFAFAWFGTLGLGDVKLAAVLGAALLPAFGWPALATAFVAAYVLATPHAAVLLVARRRTGQTAGSSELAFGPYLVAGTLVAVAFALAGSG